jgi:LysR family positive regulator for ilvC
MDHHALRLFLHLSQTLHFLRTSRACHVSPSALSRAIQRLEQEVGRPLFERDRRTVRLTPEGTRFLPYARDTLDRWERVQRELAGPAGKLTGTIGIFASVTACQSFLPGMLTGFRERHPDIHIKLETGYAADALEMLEQGRVDVAVAALPDRVPRALVARVLLHTPLVFVAPTAKCEVERLCHARPIPWAEVPVVLPSTGLARESADRWFRRKGIAPLVYGEVAGSEASLSLVALGCAIGVVPRIVFEKSPLRDNARVLTLGAKEPVLGEFRVGVCTPRRKLALPLVHAFWEALDENSAASSV